VIPTAVVRQASPPAITITTTVTTTVTEYLIQLLDERGRLLASYRMPKYGAPEGLEELVSYAVYSPEILERLLELYPPPPPNAPIQAPSTAPPRDLATRRVWVMQWAQYISALADVEQRRQWLLELASQRGRQDLVPRIQQARTLGELYEVQRELES
jgi:hypothetical protein